MSKPSKYNKTKKKDLLPSAVSKNENAKKSKVSMKKIKKIIKEGQTRDCTNGLTEQLKTELSANDVNMKVVNNLYNEIAEVLKKEEEKKKEIESLELRKKVRYLVKDDNEDIEIWKLLCLHLLTLHPVFQCKPEPFKNINNEYVRFTRYTETLPHYIIDNEDIYNCRCFRELNRINDPLNYHCTHLAVSEKLENLMFTILEAIRKGNPEKYEKLWVSAHDTHYLKQLLSKVEFHRYMRMMKDSLENIIYDDMKTVVCELTDSSFTAINSLHSLNSNTVFLLKLTDKPSLRHFYLDKTDRYYRLILELGASLNNVCALSYEPGLCILQNPAKPSALAITSDDGMYTVMVNGPQFYHDNSNLFQNIAVYVKFKKRTDKYKNDWIDIKKKYNTERLTPEEKIQKETENENPCDDEEFTENLSLLKKMVNDIPIGECKAITNEYRRAINTSNLEIPLCSVIRKSMKVPTALKLLAKCCTVEERGRAMKSTNYGGLGFARLIFGKRIMKEMKEISSLKPIKLILEPIFKSKLLAINLGKLDLIIPNDLEQIYQEVYKIESGINNKKNKNVKCK